MRAVFSYALLGAIVLGAGCEQKKPAMMPPPPKVTAANPIVRDVTQWDEYTGRLEPVATQLVQSHVTGYVTSVPFVEGSMVHKGDVILTIDPRPFQADLDSAKAMVKQAQAKMQLAKDDLARGEQAQKNGVLSAEELDTRRATLAQNAGMLEGAEAAVRSAALNVEWCTVRAEITGRISSKGITPGNMVIGGGSSNTVITSIATVDPIYCYVEADESSVLKYQRLSREHRRVSAEQEPIACYMELADEKDFPHVGTIDFLDNKLNPATGTRRARGIFPNADGALLPGFFARLRVVGEELKGALLVIDDSVGTDQDRNFVYVLHPDNTVERRNVVIGPLEGELRVIRSGLKAQDRVLVNGLLNMVFVRPGGTVDPAVVPMPEHRLAPLPPGTAPTTEPATQAAGMPASAPATQPARTEGGK